MVTMNRRSALKAGTCAGLSLAAVGYHCELPAVDSNAPSNKLNLGAIGVWTRGRTNIIASESENIAALCDVDASYLDRIQARHTRAKKYVDFRKMLEQKDLDAVIVSTPDHTHFHAVKLALERGLHVYCEKPLAHSVAEVDALVEAAKQADVTTQHGNQHHASRGYHLAVDMIRSGSIGQVQEVHSWTSKPHWPQGIARPASTQQLAHLNWDLWLGPAPSRPFADVYHPSHWRGFWDFGTGALGDMGPHLLDPVFTALELSTPTTMRPTSSEVNDETAPSWSIIEFEFKEAKFARSPLKVTWYDGGKQPPTETTGIKRLPPNGTMLIAEGSKLFIPQLGGDPILLGGDADRDDAEGVTTERLDQHQEFFAACKSNQDAACSFVKVQSLIKTCLLGNVALRVGQPLTWDESKNQFPDNAKANELLSRPYREGWPAR